MNDAPRGTDNFDEQTVAGSRDRRAMLVAALTGALATIAGAAKVSAAENDFTAAELDILRFAQRLELTARDLYDAAMAAGATDDGAPGLRSEYRDTYYGAFVLDPDGHKIEAVHLPPR